MDKTIGLLGIGVLMVAVLAVFAAADTSISCTDSDGGKDVWTAGEVTYYDGPNEVTKADNCDGLSENLKEFYCEGTDGKLDNIKCTDFNAVCVSDGDTETGDYCACPEGFDFVDDMCVAECVGCQCDNSCQGFCDLHPSDPSCTTDVPEFSVVTLGIAVLGAGLGIALLRKKH